MLTYDQFIEKYKPITNPNTIDNDMFDTVGEDFDFVKKQTVNQVWTVVEGDNNSAQILPGFHTVNRMNYMVTENPWDDENIIVEYIEEMYFCDSLNTYIEPEDNYIFLSFIRFWNTLHPNKSVTSELENYDNCDVDIFQLFEHFEEEMFMYSWKILCETWIEHFQSERIKPVKLAIKVKEGRVTDVLTDNDINLDVYIADYDVENEENADAIVQQHDAAIKSTPHKHNID